MLSSFKKIFSLWIIFFSTFLHADLLAYKHIFVSDAAGVYESSGPLTFAISIDDDPSSLLGTGTLTVYYKTITSSSSTAGEDYTLTEGNVTFVEGGPTTLTFTVPILNDAIYESTEYVYVQITEDSLVYEIDDDIGVGTIYDDDTQPLEINVHNGYTTETDGSSNISFYVELNQPAPSGGVKVTYSTSDDTAVSSEDYELTIDYITIPEGSSSGYIYIPIVGDTTPEDASERFMLDLSSCEGTINSQAIGTIYDDDAIKVYVSCDDVEEGDEGESNNVPCRIYLDKDYPLESDLTIDYSAEDGYNPYATKDSDYRATSGSVTFSKGDSEKFVNIPTIGDNTIEEDEELKLKISGSDYIVVYEDSAKILNDDGSYPALSFDEAEFSIVEGNESETLLNFTLTLDRAAEEDGSFDYYTQDNTAEGGSDFQEIELDSYTIKKGDTTVTLSIKIYGDTDIEEDEDFKLYITNEDHIVVNTHSATGIILNDDGNYPKLSFSTTDISEDEGNSTHEINVTLILDKPALSDCSFSYATADGDAKSGDNDYQSIATTSYTFPEGNTSVTFPVTVNGDITIEPDESFYFRIDDLNNLTLDGEDEATITLLNDDGSYPTISIESASYTLLEGNESTTELEIKLLLDKPAPEEGEISIYTTDDTATDGSLSTEDNDYVQLDTTITIPQGEEELTVTLSIVGDTNIEPDEQFKFSIHDPKKLLLGAQTSTTISILDDDVHNEEPFECDEHMYLSSSKKRGSEETGRMWLHRINTTTNPFKFEVMDDEGEDRLYNALAYNPEDNYIYALYHRELLKISQTGKVMSQGTIEALPSDFDSYQLFAGAIYDNEHYYVSGIGVDSNKIYTINLLDKSVSEIIMSQSINVKDFSLSSKGEYLYGIIDGGEFTKISTLTGVVNKIGPAHSGEFDSSFSDKNDRFFANDSEGSGFYEFDTTTGEKAFLSDSQPATYNDGANCLNAELVFTDYGDAPHDDGKYYGDAWHNIIGGIYLGEKVDHDPQSYANLDATGDDTNGSDDEDGVVLLDGSDLEGAYLEDNTTHQLKVTLSKEAYLRIWVDLDIDGWFDNGHDLLYDDKLTAGEHTINVTLPEGLTQNVTTYLRARVSSIPAMDYQGYLQDGEVEDYAIKFGSAIQPLRGVFNIERTNSGDYAINSDERNAWYTQIVGRDFDYSVLFYDEDMNGEKEIDNVTVKLELFDQDSNTILYQRYAHIKNDPPKSRIDIVLPENDLANVPATKKAIFRISYGINPDGSIIQADCNEEPEVCYERLPLTRTDYAFDNFAIRPETLYLSLADGEQERINSTSPHPISLAAGYEYNLTIKAIKSRNDYPDFVASEGYNTTLVRRLDFNGSLSCNQPQDQDLNITMNEGYYNDTSFKHENVGHYQLLVLEDNNWTSIDQNDRDCISENSTTSTDGNTPSGCSIGTLSPIEIDYQPDHFDINLVLNNLPNSGHPTFIYMSELNSTYSRVAIGFEGNISAKSASGVTTSNFTQGCVATNVLLDLNSTTISEEGLNQIIHTTEGTEVYFTRWIQFNHDLDPLHLDINQTLPFIQGSFMITPDKFLDENNGSLYMDIRYNLNKHLTQPINPVEVTFHAIELNSTEANSTAHDPINIDPSIYTPKGSQTFINNRKNFYFTRVVSDLSIYPQVNLNISPVVRTPLNVDIFCKSDILNYCRDRDVLLNTNITGTMREEQGWYLSANHNASKDGNVTQLIPNHNNITITPNPLADIMLEHGENGLISNKFVDCSFSEVTVRINSFPELAFEPSEYTISCTDMNASQWTGIGKAGNILGVQPKINKSYKMDW